MAVLGALQPLLAEVDPHAPHVAGVDLHGVFPVFGRRSRRQGLPGFRDVLTADLFEDSVVFHGINILDGYTVYFMKTGVASSLGLSRVQQPPSFVGIGLK